MNAQTQAVTIPSNLVACVKDALQAHNLGAGWLNLTNSEITVFLKDDPDNSLAVMQASGAIESDVGMVTSIRLVDDLSPAEQSRMRAISQFV